MEPRKPSHEPEAEEAVQSDHQRRGLGSDRGTNVRRRFARFPAPGQLGQPGPADDLDRDAEGRGGGDEEQEEAVVAGLFFLYFFFLNEKTSEFFFRSLMVSSTLPLAHFSLPSDNFKNLTPTHCPTQGQWWSNRSTQLSQIAQCEHLGGRWWQQVEHHLDETTAPVCGTVTCRLGGLWKAGDGGT